MASLMRFLRKLRDLVGWAYLPTDMRGLWDFFRPYALPVLGGATIAAVAWFRDAPLWQISFLTVVVALFIYVGILLVGSVRRHMPPTDPKPDDKPHPPEPPPGRSPAQLKALCIHLGKDVRAFHYDQAGFTGNPTDEEVRRREEETVRTYRARFRPAIMDLYGELVPNWFHDGDRELFENLSEWSQLQDVAERLETVGERLPDR